MKNNKTYHIDVTPEEDALFRELSVEENQHPARWQRFMSGKTLAIIALVHLAGVAAIYALSSKEPTPQVVTSPSPTPPVAVVAEEQPTSPPPLATPPPLPPPQQPPPIKPPSITTQYTVKQGDTFYSIVKRYKLNPDVLIKLNNIQDPSKLKTGQVLKFVK